MPRTLPILLVSSAIAVLAGCSNKTSDSSLIFINTTEAKSMIAQPTGAFGSRGDEVNLWLDPRSPSEYAESHIPGAMSLPFPLIRQDHDSMLRNARTIVLYGNNDNDPIGIAASKRLMELGYKNIYTLRGGFEAWTATGAPTETGEPTQSEEEQAARR